MSTAMFKEEKQKISATIVIEDQAKISTAMTVCSRPAKDP